MAPSANARQADERRNHHHGDDEKAGEIDQNGRDEQTHAVLVTVFRMVNAERDNHKNETDQRSGRASGKRVETIPIVHHSRLPSPRL
jgi:hypothetical protein